MCIIAIAYATIFLDKLIAIFKNLILLPVKVSFTARATTLLPPMDSSLLDDTGHRANTLNENVEKCLMIYDWLNNYNALFEDT